MKLLGLERIPALFRRARHMVKMLDLVGYSSGGWYSILREPFAGAWQEGVSYTGPREIVAFSAVFACITIIANDIAKLRVKVMVRSASGVGQEVVGKDVQRYRVLKRPNHYQNWMQFALQWVLSKLLYGNAYVLKSRNARGDVDELYVLDPQRVQALVAESGDVYYRLARDDLSGLKDAVVVPAENLIHDLMNPLFHPLCGVSPIYACALSASMGRSIQKNSSKFFTNMSRPSGALSAPGTIDDVTANRMKEEWEKNFTGENIGRLAVLGDGLKYEAMTIPAQEAQLIEQLNWTSEDVARCFHVPYYKIGGEIPPNSTIGALNQGYYSDCLQALIEAMEWGLDEGLGFPEGTYSELDLDGLLRMDPAARYESWGKAVKEGWMKPDEARAKEDMLPVEGGDQCYLQQQNYSLAALAKRDAKEDPFAGAAPQRRSSDAAPPPAPPAALNEADLGAFAEKFALALEASDG